MDKSVEANVDEIANNLEVLKRDVEYLKKYKESDILDLKDVNARVKDLELGFGSLKRSDKYSNKRIDKLEEQLGDILKDINFIRETVLEQGVGIRHLDKNVDELDKTVRRVGIILMLLIGSTLGVDKLIEVFKLIF